MVEPSPHDLWGELRSFVHQPTQPLHEALHLLARMPFAERQRAVEYLRRMRPDWSSPSATLIEDEQLRELITARSWHRFALELAFGTSWQAFAEREQSPSRQLLTPFTLKARWLDGLLDEEEYSEDTQAQRAENLEIHLNLETTADAAFPRLITEALIGQMLHLEGHTAARGVCNVVNMHHKLGAFLKPLPDGSANTVERAGTFLSGIGQRFQQMSQQREQQSKLSAALTLARWAIFEAADAKGLYDEVKRNAERVKDEDDDHCAALLSDWLLRQIADDPLLFEESPEP